MKINWDSFKTHNQDASGVRFKFEALCRQLFANENLIGNKQFKYLHANPNNHGLETEPVFDEIRKRWVGFQAKFFDETVDYTQIRHSAEKTVEYYTGKEGTVDLVYLFCNKPITSTAKGYLETVKLLKDSNIELQLITDNAILDLVRNKYSYLGLYYFGNYSLSQNWFVTQGNRTFGDLGDRYNHDFNVETKSLDDLSLFLLDQQAADFLNMKKQALIEKAEALYRSIQTYQDYLKVLLSAVSSLPDVTTETLNRSFEWKNAVMEVVRPFLEEVEEDSKKLQLKRDKFYVLSQNQKISKSKREEAIRNYSDIERQLNDIEILMALPNHISITDRERQLLCSNVMALYGRAGTGKSQMLAYKTNCFLEREKAALLLLAGNFFTESPIHEQIISNLHLECSFEDLIDTLETIGERENCIVPMFIDALNETWHSSLWKIGLPAIIDKIEQTPMVKLVVSLRPEYESSLFGDSIRDKIEKKAIVTLIHRGFEENSHFAVRDFLNHYNIPFSPLEYFSTEMSNPLFLTLYCKTYNGEEVNLPTLYERIIKKANDNVYSSLQLRSKGYPEGYDILKPLILQMASYMVFNGHRAIKKEELMRLSFWSENGIAAGPLIYQLVKEDILHNYADQDTEYYFFAFDQMNDYYCAKAIFYAYKNKDEVRNYLIENVLKIENGKLKKLSGIDLFVNACALYAEKYDEECIDIIDSVEEQYEKWEVISRYISSFQWRAPRTTSKDLLYCLLKKYPCNKDDLWPMLIGNSIKTSHPLNADFLHSFLSSYMLNKRDSLWTVYVNDFPSDDENRVVQLIQMYDRGEKLDNTNRKQIELILTLFGWLLTSSNRWLRDYTSKAMIEILKEHFQLCVPILEKFKDVDDPYVVQRLFGIVFGACCKRNGGDLQNLAEYVYETVFDQEKVFPDILLRDYARLIIEKFLNESPDYIGLISLEKITPPYNSDPIPEIEDQHYLEKEYSGAMFWLLNSMRFEGMGMYGDFGRYVFQGALHSFEVDDKKMFNYAIYHILNVLGFNEEFFGEHDQHCGGYDRSRTIKTERIGKKYQWITMYNMLARISDNCKMIDYWDYPPKEDATFEGAWEPYVRDFDPTLNTNFMVCSDAPVFSALEDHILRGISENRANNYVYFKDQKTWLETRGIFFEDLKDTLILTDNNGRQWICLTKYCDTGRKDLNTEKLLVWSWMYAYFVTPEQAEGFAKCADKGLSVVTSPIGSHHEAYTIFNREYPWAPSCREFEENAWVEAQIKTGEYETITEKIPVADLTKFDAIMKKYCGSTDDEVFSKYIGLLTGKGKIMDDLEDFEGPKLQLKEETRRREVEEEIGRILHATTDLRWEAEYDATTGEGVSYSFPCAKLIKLMDLKQEVTDGYLYDPRGKLAAFDTDLTQNIHSVVVRKDVLDSFLAKTRLRLIWLVDAGKEIHADDRSIADWSTWEAVFAYEGDHIAGQVHRIQQRDK